MKRRGSKRGEDGDVRGAVSDRPRSLSSGGSSSGKEGALPGSSRPNFWDELYWFTVICLGGWILALAVLPPALVRLREALAFEAECRQRVEALSTRNAELARVVNAFETNAQFREEVMRTILGVKKQDEVFLK